MKHELKKAAWLAGTVGVLGLIWLVLPRRHPDTPRLEAPTESPSVPYQTKGNRPLPREWEQNQPPTHAHTHLAEIEQALSERPSATDSEIQTLMENAKNAIQHDPLRADDWFENRMLKAAEIPTESSLFLVKAMIRHSPKPTQALYSVLKIPSPKTAPSFSHSNFSPQVKVNLIKVYALEELGERVLNDPTQAQQMGQLLPTLIELAKSTPDLALAREAAQRIRQLHPQAGPILRDIIYSRTREERFAFEDLLT